MQLSQRSMESKYSKRMAGFIAIDTVLDRPKVIEACTVTIDSWRNGETIHLTPKVLDLLDSLPDTEEVVIEVMTIILLNYYTVNLQKVSVEIGSALGYRSTSDAARIGSELVGVLFGSCANLFKLFEDEEGTVHIEPGLSLSPADKREIAKLTLLPPNVSPRQWVSNTKGGFEWETKSVILGKRTHHNEPQALDVLNKIQAVAYTIDLETLVAEKQSMGRSERPSEQRNLGYNWSEVIGDYIGEEFYFTYRFDTRGRMYPSGYQINPSGNELAKAMVIPAKKEKCTKEGLIALKEHILDLDSGPLRRKAIRAYREAKDGKAIQYFMECDASSSGAQMLSILSGCKKTAKLCNLTDAPQQDLYQSVLDQMGVSERYTRKQVKKAIMTAMYNSKKTPADTFGSDIDLFWKTLNEMCPGAMEAMEAINSCFDPFATERTWVMPDGHVVKVPVKLDVEERITINSMDRRMTLKYKVNQANKGDKSLPANVAHATDSLIMREVIRRADFDISPLHKQHCASKTF